MMIDYLNFIINIAVLILLSIYGTKHITRVSGFMDETTNGFNKIQLRIEELINEIIKIKGVLISTLQGQDE